MVVISDDDGGDDGGDDDDGYDDGYDDESSGDDDAGGKDGGNDDDGNDNEGGNRGGDYDGHNGGMITKSDGEHQCHHQSPSPLSPSKSITITTQYLPSKRCTTQQTQRLLTQPQTYFPERSVT